MSRVQFKTTLFAVSWGLALANSVLTAESDGGSHWPQWDGTESAQTYARRAGVPERLELSLPGGGKIEFALIPAARFIMGQSEIPAPSRTPVLGRTLVCGAVGLLLALLLPMLGAWITRHKAPQYSLAGYSLFIGGLCLLGYGITSWVVAENDRVRYELDKAVDKKLSDSSAKPAHEVLLPRPFYMARTEVTQECFQALVDSPPLKKVWPGTGMPVATTREDADLFCRRLDQVLQSAVMQLPVGQRGVKWHAKLPSEAQWEHACRAGTKTRFWYGDDPERLDEVAWFGAPKEGPHPVGLKPPNPWGLFDMHGNMDEFVSDWYHTAAYQWPPPPDPEYLTEPEGFDVRLVRGGNYSSPFGRCSSFSRNRFSQGQPHFGIRPVLVPEE